MVKGSGLGYRISPDFSDKVVDRFIDAANLENVTEFPDFAIF